MILDILDVLGLLWMFWVVVSTVMTIEVQRQLNCLGFREFVVGMFTMPYTLLMIYLKVRGGG